MPSSCNTLPLTCPITVKFQKGKWSGVVGSVYFNTDNWDSRLYLIEPGLKGEFRIQPYFLVGISIYLKVNWKINDSNSLSFRYSSQKGEGEIQRNGTPVGYCFLNFK